MRYKMEKEAGVEKATFATFFLKLGQIQTHRFISSIKVKDKNVQIKEKKNVDDLKSI